MKLLKNKLTVTVIVLSVAFLWLIVFTASKNTKGLESVAGSTLNPVQKVAYNLNRGIKDFVDFFLNFSEVKAENKALKNENHELKNKIAESANLQEEYDSLKSMLDLKEQKDNYEYIATNIIGYAGSGVVDGYIIDKGKKDGIEKSMVVVTGAGLVGQVSNVGINWAIIQPIINENIKVSVMDSEGRNTGILSGYKDSSGEYLVEVTNLELNADIEVGDTIVTSGLGLLYPKELIVGEVISIQEDKVNVMKSAIVKPSVEFKKLEELFVVVPIEDRDIQNPEN